MEEEFIGHFINEVRARMQHAFPDGDAEWDHNGAINMYHEASGKFVHVVVVFSSWEKDGDKVYVNARPESMFEDVIASKPDLFQGAESWGEEFDDGEGNFVWELSYPHDAERIGNMCMVLAQTAAAQLW